MIRAAVAAGLLAWGAASGPAPWTSEPLPDRDARFLPDGSPWRGGDAVVSVPLSPDRILWLFGDTFVAAPGRSERAGSRLVRNTLALERPAGALDYSWGTADGHPDDALRPAAGPGWLWPLSGVRLGDRAHLFMIQMIARGQGAFGFALQRSVLVTVENPDDPPGLWKTHESRLPESVGSSAGDLFIGSACQVSGDTLYALGVREHPGAGPGGRGVLLARVARGAVEERDAWRFYTGEDWNPDPARAREIFRGGAVEMSLSPLAGGLAAVYTRDGLSPEIVVRRAPRPEGPWGEAEVVHRCPETGWNPKYFCYAAKAHPELARSDRELIVSYAANSTDFGLAVRDFRIYRPRFLRIRME